MTRQAKYISFAFIILSVLFIAFYFAPKLIPKRQAFGCGVVDDNSLKNSDTTKQYKDGKALFQQCGSCHILFKDFTGPDLIGFTERGPWGDKKKLLSFLREPFKFYTQNRSSYVDSLYEYSPVAHLVFLWDEKKLDDFIYYINSEEKYRNSKTQ